GPISSSSRNGSTSSSPAMGKGRRTTKPPPSSWRCALITRSTLRVMFSSPIRVPSGCVRLVGRRRRLAGDERHGATDETSHQCEQSPRLAGPRDSERGIERQGARSGEGQREGGGGEDEGVLVPTAV